MKKLIILGAFLFSINSLNAQTSTNYEEASNPISTNPSLWVKVSAPQVSWGSTDIRYKKEEPAPIARLKKDINLTAWKGERVSAQLVVWTPEALDNLSFIVSDLTSGKETISKDNVRTGFVRYVMTDEYYFSADCFYRLHYIRQHSACIVRDRQASLLPESNIYPPKTKYIYPDSNE